LARKRIKMKKIRDIIKYKCTTDMSERRIARALSISRPVVAEYWRRFKETGLSYEQANKMPDSELLGLLEHSIKHKNDKYKILSGYFPYYVKELMKTGVTLQLLWQEYKEKYSDGCQYSQFCYHFQMWRGASELTMHIEHKAGDKMFCDYAGTRMSIYDAEAGQENPVEVFIAILGASGLTYAEASLSQEKQEWIRSNERALWYFGGVPAAIVPDNLKAAVSKSDPYEPGINPGFDDFADYYGTVIIPARVRKARDKALVENAVKLVYQRVYAPLRNMKFYSLEELNQAIRELIDKHNTTLFQRLNYSRRDLFEQVEKRALKSLPKEKYPQRQIRYVTVQINYHVELREDKHYYSVPHWIKKNIGKTKVKMVFDERVVALYYDNVRIAQHMRDKTPNRYTTEPDHMPSHHRVYVDWSPERIINWGRVYGEEVAGVLRRVMKYKKHPEQGFKVCLGIIRLGKKYGAVKLNAACRKANQFGLYSLKRIESMVKLMQEEEEKQTSLSWQDDFISHENIRGSGYYN
jgi:transposase